MEFQTERLLIRPFTMDDAQDVHSFCRLPEVMDLSGMGPAHTGLAQTEAELAKWMQTGCKHAMELRATGRVIGEISVKPDSEEHRADTRELGCALHPDFQRQGYMTEAIAGVLAELKRQGIRFVWVCCFTENKRSRALIERCGFLFQQCGTFTVKATGQTHGSYEYRMDLMTWPVERSGIHLT